MRRIAMTFLALMAAFLLGVSVRDLNVQAQGGAGDATPAGNGDVNADGAFDLGDAVYLLRWLFQGGSPPAPIEAGPSRPLASLPTSGQARCYNPDGSEVDCAAAQCPGQDGAYQAGCPDEGRFVDHGDGTVTDTCTGLHWQQQTADVNGDEAITDADMIPFCASLAYCENLTLAGRDDWRLPSVRELASLVNYGSTWPAVDPVFGVPAAFPVYMTSTTLRGGPAPGVFSVDFGVGLVSGGGGIVCHIRAVRNADSP